MKKFLVMVFAIAICCSCTDGKKNLYDFDKDYEFTAELTTSVTEVVPGSVAAFDVALKDMGSKADGIKISCKTSGGGFLNLNGVDMVEQQSLLDVKSGDKINYMPTAVSGSFIITFSNAKSTDRIEVVIKEEKDDEGKPTGKGYVSSIRQLY